MKWTLAPRTSIFPLRKRKETERIFLLIHIVKLLFIFYFLLFASFLGRHLRRACAKGKLGKEMLLYSFMRRLHISETLTSRQTGLWGLVWAASASQLSKSLLTLTPRPDLETSRSSPWYPPAGSSRIWWPTVPASSRCYPCPSCWGSTCPWWWAAGGRRTAASRGQTTLPSSSPHTSPARWHTLTA